MEDFEAQLARAAAPDTRDVLGAIGLVDQTLTTPTGTTLYHHACGRQSLDADAPPLDADSTVSLGSAGKFLTHIAALQLVEHGLVGLDDPVSTLLPELDALPLISRSSPFAARPPATKITLRHLLTHTSGLSTHDDPAVQSYLAAGGAMPTPAPDAHPIVRATSLPLTFNPGTGFAYGHSIHWAQLLVARAAPSGNFIRHMQTHVFDVLNMRTATFGPRDREDVWHRRLRMVERAAADGSLVEADDATQGLTCSVRDVGAALADLLAPAPRLLSRRDLVDLLFEPQFAAGSGALRDLRGEKDNYAFCAGRDNYAFCAGRDDYAFCAGRMGDGGEELGVNWSAAGLVVEDDVLRLSGMPRGTVAWEGMPNVMWAVNREKGVAAFFATQLVPNGDERANRLAVAFMRGAWGTFGSS
ncbi:beta-lactamase/transpeptidase-like protein [Lasiosphaeria miniovina]|uniref:Beta-lactamase/transpeptidase-like protein n=1 Tax=Lasiosphaeria miniovina TaxID=1954250 RepID=A0AA39ZYX6_9PEZI|nr:beta-lactamase/transpeptidase-like protein [Lasiosphaeria miniovina]KAK0706226.1 beta-lactamase/transpeptidase-like protein [Lasiosphaeria miniovina]